MTIGAPLGNKTPQALMSPSAFLANPSPRAGGSIRRVPRLRCVGGGRLRMFLGG